jgi:hypothetical protein
MEVLPWQELVTPSEKQTKGKRTGGLAQVIEQKALSSIPS